MTINGNTGSIGNIEWDLLDRVCLVTGANRGMGKVVAQELARLGARVVMLCRDEAKGETTQREIQDATENPYVDLAICDLASQEQIRHFTKNFKANYGELNVLIHNAGVLKHNYTETEDGIETTFAVNHLAPFLITNLLFEMLLKSDRARVVTVSSMVHKWGEINFDDLNGREGYNIDTAYCQSKLANILFTNELAERMAGTPATANSMEPGLMKTDFGREYRGFKSFMAKVGRIVMREPEEGAQTAIYLAASPDVEGISGRHFVDGKPVESSLKSNDPVLAKRLWEVSAELTGLQSKIRSQKKSKAQ